MISRQRKTGGFVLFGSLVLLCLIGIPQLKKAGVTTLPGAIEGQPVPGSVPGVCIGFDPAANAFGYGDALCPAYHAYVGTDDPAGVESPAEKISARMPCCPVSAPDVLTDEHAFSPDACPQEFVATGQIAKETPAGAEYLLRCTKINTARYQLGAATPGLYWGDGYAGWENSTVIRWENIPAAIRYAHGRNTKDAWDVDGCASYPWGSLLTKKTTKYCSGFAFQQLQFRGVPGDPAQATPVKLFAQCSGLQDVNNPGDPGCIQ